MHRETFTLSSQTIKRRKLREERSKAELLLWEKFKSRQLSGYKFRRQHSVGRFVVDFYCPLAKLVIEVDGDSHFLGNGTYDKERQKIIESFGLKFLRFTNTEIFQNMEQVIGGVIEVLKVSSPSNSPSRRGRN